MNPTYEWCPMRPRDHLVRDMKKSREVFVREIKKSHAPPPGMDR